MTVSKIEKRIREHNNRKIAFAIGEITAIDDSGIVLIHVLAVIVYWSTGGEKSASNGRDALLAVGGQPDSQPEYDFAHRSNRHCVLMLL